MIDRSMKAHLGIPGVEHDRPAAVRDRLGKAPKGLVRGRAVGEAHRVERAARAVAGEGGGVVLDSHLALVGLERSIARGLKGRRWLSEE